MSSYKKFADIGTPDTLDKDGSPVSHSVTNKNSQSDLTALNKDLIILENAEHKKQLIATNKIVVFDIYGDFCGPCKSIAPRFASLAKEYSPKGFVFVKEDVEKKISPEIRGVPAFQYWYKGRLLDTTVGADMQEVKAKIDKLLELHTTGL